jgi:hypothetical protein
MIQVTERAAVSQWLAGYEAAWRVPGTGDLARLFTSDATYLQGPYRPPVTGLDAIGRMWEAEREGPDEVFTLATDIIAVDGQVRGVALRARGLAARNLAAEAQPLRMAANRSTTVAAVWSGGASQTSALKISTSTSPSYPAAVTAAEIGPKSMTPSPT